MVSIASNVFLSFFCLFNAIIFPVLTNAVSSCNGPCKTLNDCAGQLVCINKKCTDDPDVGTNIYGGDSGDCKPFGFLRCQGESHSQYRCSPPVTSSTKAVLTLNDFSEGGEGGDPSECDEKYHCNSERVMALSTGWYAGGARCGKMIRITAKNGRSVTAKVVGECDREHAGHPPCPYNNNVDASKAVWDALGLNTNEGVVPVTWSMA